MTPEEAASIIRRQREENNVARQILVAMRKHASASGGWKKKMSSPEFKGEDYAAERKLGDRVVNYIAVSHGIFWGLANFFMLRGGPRVLLKLLRGSGAASSSQRPGYQLERSSLDPPQFSNVVARGLKLVVDVSLSLTIAGLVTVHFTDDQKITQDLAGLPLVEGRSVVCDEFCTILQQEVAKHSPQFWQAAHRNIYLTSMKQIAENCAKRQAYERQLREEQGLPPDTPIAIPSGGVPPSYELTDPSSDEARGGSNESQLEENYFGEGFSDSEGDSLFGDEAVDQWGNSLVTDREDQRK